MDNLNKCKIRGEINNIGFVSTRFAGTDGVSLETVKWADVLERRGFKCFYFAGELDREPEISYFSDLAHFNNPEILDINQKCFGESERERSVTEKIHNSKNKLKDDLYKFVKKFGIDLLIPENVLAIPLNIPLGLAITEFIAETGIKTISHNHDFFWERTRFMVNCVWDYLNMAFPPHIPFIQHVVINSSADNQLSLRTGISATMIPNVMDFETPPPSSVCNNDKLRDSLCITSSKTNNDYNSDVRKALGIGENEILVLQPTRVVKRKGIEHAIELLHRLEQKGVKARLVISHASGDEGDSYEQRVRNYSKLMNINTIFVSEIIGHKRGKTKDGRKIYTLEDIYPHADLVTYPSNFEGFGNAFLEAIYFCKPVVVNKYSIYSIDIKPKCFDVIEIDGYVSEDAVEKTKQVLENPDIARQMAVSNYLTAKKYFSYKLLDRKLMNLIKN